MEVVHRRTLLPDPFDARDHYFCDIHGHKSEVFSNPDNSADSKNLCSVKQQIAQQIKPQVDLRELLTSEIINQGLLNSCSACAIAVAAELYLIRDRQPFIDENASNIDASQMFVYYNERVMEDKVDMNAPVFIRNGIKSLFKHGICSEKSWPYPEMAMPESLYKLMATGTAEQIQQEVNRILSEHQDEIQSAVKEKPSEQAIKQAGKHIINRYCRLDEEDDLTELRLALSKGMPVIFGMMVPRSFYAIKEDGVMTMPSPTDVRLGGHALLAVGYDDKSEMFIVRNSWGEEFGDKGYCYMPYEFFCSKFEQDGEPQDNTFSYWCLTHE